MNNLLERMLLKGGGKLNVLTLDTEHSAGIYNPWEEGFYLCNVGLKFNDDLPTIIWFEHSTYLPTPNATEQIQDMIDQADLIVGQNLKHDVNILRYYGIKFNNKPLYCTQIADYLINGHDTTIGYDMNSIADRYGIQLKLDKVKHYWDLGVDTKDIPEPILAEYLKQDVIITEQIYIHQKPEIARWELERVCKVQNEFTYTLSDIELNGFKWDIDKMARLVKEAEDELSAITHKLLEYSPDKRLNLGSNDHLSAYLFGGVAKVKWKEWVVQTLKVRPESYYKEVERTENVELKGLGFTPIARQKKDGYFKTGKEIIPKLVTKTDAQKEVKKLLIDLRKQTKVLSTLIGKKGDKGKAALVQPDGRIHAKMNQTITKTGRLSSDSQNFPRGSTSPLKECIVPTFDKIMEFDLSQVEWRSAAYLSQDAVMIHEVNSGIDQHSETTVKLMELPLNKVNRTNAKIFNFRMIYGGTWYAFWIDEKMPNFSKKKWQKIVRDFFEKYIGLQEYHEACIFIVSKQGYLQIPTGRYFRYHKEENREGYKDYPETKIKNYGCQGIAGGDILPLYACQTRRAIRYHKLKSKFILTVHDSLVFDVVEEEVDILTYILIEIVEHLAESVSKFYKINFNVKLDGEIKVGDSYGSVKEIAASNAPVPTKAGAI